MVLATTKDLADYHTRRATLYHAIARMLGAPQGRRALEQIDELLSERPHSGSAAQELRAALAAYDGDRTLKRLDASVLEREPPTCTGDHARIRSEAFAVTGRAEDSHPESDALVLYALAERSARALARGDLLEASALCELQQRFIAGHATACFAEVRRRLETSKSTYDMHLARAIEQVLTEDLEMLRERRVTRTSGSKSKEGASP